MSAISCFLALSTLPFAMEFSTFIENLSGNGKWVGRVEPFSLLLHTSGFLFVVGVDVVVRGCSDKGSPSGKGEMEFSEHWLLKSRDVTAIEEQLL